MNFLLPYIRTHPTCFGKETFTGEGFPDVFRNKNGIFALGVNYWDSPYKGLIDELKIYSRALKSEEVLANYQMYEQ